jgi:Tetracyclin repressor-like, C-terminal domain
MYMQRWENLPDNDPWPALVRSALSHQTSAQLLRSALDAQLAAPLRKGSR